MVSQDSPHLTHEMGQEHYFFFYKVAPICRSMNNIWEIKNSQGMDITRHKEFEVVAIYHFNFLFMTRVRIIFSLI